MCLDEYVAKVLVEDRLREMQREAQRVALIDSLPREPLRVRFGRALICVGRWLAAPAPAQPSLT
jgi:hypothetical protein